MRRVMVCLALYFSAAALVSGQAAGGQQAPEPVPGWSSSPTKDGIKLSRDANESFRGSFGNNKKLRPALVVSCSKNRAQVELETKLRLPGRWRRHLRSSTPARRS